MPPRKLRRIQPSTRYDAIWLERVNDSRIRETRTKTGYSEREQLQAHLAILHDYTQGESRQQKYLIWEDYVTVMVANRPTSIGYRDMNDFLRIVMGIDPADFDWEAWRQAMGYERTRR